MEGGGGSPRKANKSQGKTFPRHFVLKDVLNPKYLDKCGEVLTILEKSQQS